MLNEPKLLLEFKGIFVYEIEDKLINIKFIGNEDYTVEDISHLTNRVLEYYNYTQFVCLTDFVNYFGTFSTKVKQYLANHEKLNWCKYSEAFVIRKLGMRIQATFYFRLFTSLRIKVFRNKEEALEWLHKKRKEIKN